jgi:glyoxylase-like metal-dependent hydrolase (beta-lactamase superfamily II)
LRSWCLFAAGLAFPHPLIGQALDLETVRVAEGVYAFIPSDRGVGNSVAIITEDAVVVVDAALPSTARAIIEKIRSFTDKPVRYVVNTHWHDDHIWGNQAYGAAFDGVEFIAHENTQQDIVALAVPGLARNIEGLTARIAERDSLLKMGVDADGEPLTAERRAAIEERQQLFREVLRDFESIEPTLPTLTFQDSHVLFPDGDPIHILYFGQGNTRGDAVVYVPSKKVVITGDLLTYPIPVAAGSFVVDWILTMERLASLEADVIVPGHGPVTRDWAYFELVTRLLTSVVNQVRTAIAQGLSLEQTLDTVDVEDFKAQFVGDDAALDRAFDAFFLNPAIESAYKSEAEEPGN